MVPAKKYVGLEKTVIMIWVIVGAQMIVPNGYRVMKRAIQNATMLNATGIMEIVTVIWTVLVDMSE